jgi:hypothetical protein
MGAATPRRGEVRRYSRAFDSKRYFERLKTANPTILAVGPLEAIRASRSHSCRRSLANYCGLIAPAAGAPSRSSGSML